MEAVAIRAVAAVKPGRNQSASTTTSTSWRECDVTKHKCEEENTTAYLDTGFRMTVIDGTSGLKMKGLQNHSFYQTKRSQKKEKRNIPVGKMIGAAFNSLASSHGPSVTETWIRAAVFHVVRSGVTHDFTKHCRHGRPSTFRNVHEMQPKGLLWVL